MRESFQPGNSVFDQVLQKAEAENSWFTRENILTAIEAISRQYLQEEALESWLAAYPDLPVKRQRRVGLIMAGNIPLVGFHDFLCGLFSGHKIYLKLSSKDTVLFEYVLNQMYAAVPELQDDVQAVERLVAPEAIIATGSNTTSAYFQRYFGHLPHIFRGHRNSVAVLSGQETEQELVELGRDIFTYFGLGCRNVAKLLVPESYPVANLADYWKKFQYVIFHNKYRNNYDYYRAMFLINKMEHIATSLILMREDVSPASPVAVLHYETYRDAAAQKEALDRDASAIQCIVGRGYLAFGQSQYPSLFDYADGVDTMSFLSGL
ncbi:MAG: acyl-CoA reductase [Chitinophagales bacterium]|nr:acyl-CoA reductase [Chitinophagales bacterium]MDW8428666.1 acyl-CoA reductase [Chitinophagales bacterium]